MALNDRGCIWIEEPTDPRVAHFSKIRDGAFKARDEIIVDSELIARRVAEAGLEVKEIFATASFYADCAEVLARLPCLDQVVRYLADRQTLERVVGYRLHQGVMMVARRPDDSPLADFGERVVVLNGVSDAENVGAIVRNCHAFGVHSLLIDASSCSPWVRRAIRVAMGSTFRMKIHHSLNLVRDLQEIADSGYQIVATANRPAAEPLHGVVMRPRVALVMGNEYAGVSDQILGLSDLCVKIPVDPTIDSLNVAVASGILLHQLYQTSGSR